MLQPLLLALFSSETADTQPPNLLHFLAWERDGSKKSRVGEGQGLIDVFLAEGQAVVLRKSLRFCALDLGNTMVEPFGCKWYSGSATERQFSPSPSTFLRQNQQANKKNPQNWTLRAQKFLKLNAVKENIALLMSSCQFKWALLEKSDLKMGF